MATYADGSVSGPSLVHRVLEHTRTRILNGEYPPGTALRLQRLAEESGTSLIPVREALRILEAERLVITTPNKGAQVAPLSLEDMRDLYAARIVLETRAIRTARPLTGDEARELEDLLPVLTGSARDGTDQTETMRLHRRFHYAMYELCDSSWLLYLIDILWKHAERYQRASLGLRHHDEAHEEHRRVLEALVAGDNEAAAAYLEVHLRTTAHLVEEGYRVLAESGSV